MNYYSLNQVINLCEAIAGSHQQIKQFGFGEEFDISTEQQNYPLMWATVGPSTISGKTLSLGMVILVMDIVSDDARNANDTLSDTLSISQDIVAMLKDPALQDDLTIGDNITIEPLFEALPDVINGWRIDFTIDLAFESNRCQVPFNGNVFPPNIPSCAAAIVLLNGGAFLTVASGGTADVELIDENGAPVIPVSVVGSTITVPNSGGGGNVTIERTDNSQITIATAPSTFVVPDSDVVLKDSADNVLRTVSVMADSSVDETIGDVTVTLQDSNNTDISQNSYLAESSNILIAPDATAVVKDSANNVLHTVNINSNSSSDINIYDTIVQLKDSAGNNIGSPDSYLAESTNNKTAPDATVTLNGNAFLSPRSNQTVNLGLVDVYGNAITPNSLTYPNIVVNQFMFDNIGARMGAWDINFRLFLSYNGPLIRVRRSGDNAESDFSPSSFGVLDVASVTAWVVAGGGTQNGFIRTVYDQSGRGLNFEQSTMGNQPQCVSSGVAIVDGSGRIRMDFDGTKWLTISSSTSSFNFIHNGSLATIIGVQQFGKVADPNASYGWTGNSGSSSNVGFTGSYDDRVSAPSNNRGAQIAYRGIFTTFSINNSVNNIITPNARVIRMDRFDADNATAASRGQIFINGGSANAANTQTDAPSTANATFDLQWGALGNNAAPLVGFAQHLCIFNAILDPRTILNQRYNVY